MCSRSRDEHRAVTWLLLGRHNHRDFHSLMRGGPVRRSRCARGRNRHVSVQSEWAEQPRGRRKGPPTPTLAASANTKRCGWSPVTGVAVRVHNAQMYVAADVCGTVPSPSLAVCVQVAHVYAPADVCGAKTGRNIGVCVRIDNMYAASEVCCKEEGPNLGACVHAGTMCASTEVWACPPTSEGVKLHGDVVARSVRETQTDCAQSGEGIPRSSARACVGMCATGPPALWVVLS